MKERKTWMDYVEQVLKIFGFSIIILNIFCLLFGEDAEEISSIFSMGKAGLSIGTMMQFLLAAAWIVLMRFLFFTDIFVKDMRVLFRTFGMIVSSLVMMVFCIWAFRWFPIDDWLPWTMFFLCFGVCFVISLVLTVVKERMENRKMEEALKKLKMDKK